jgi:hypothetical protein
VCATCCPKLRLSSGCTSGEMLQEPASFTPLAPTPRALLPLVVKAQLTNKSMGVMMPTPEPRRLPLFQPFRVISYSLALRVKDVKVCYVSSVSLLNWCLMLCFIWN